MVGPVIDMETSLGPHMLERELIVKKMLAQFEQAPQGLIASAATLAGGDFRPPGGGRERRVASAIGRLASVDPAMLLSELDALLVLPKAALALRWLEHFGALSLLLPEVERLIGFHEDSPKHHKDLWEHTLTVLERVPADPDLRLVALAHDVGKVSTRAVLDDGTLAFHRHEAVGARLFIGIGARLGMAESRRERIAFVIEHHARTNQFEPSWSDRALRRLVRECGEYLPLMLAFSAADWTTKHKSKSERILMNHATLEARLEAVAQQDRAPRVPEGTSEALMQVAGKGPGPWLAEAKRELTTRFDIASMGPDELARRWLELQKV